MKERRNEWLFWFALGLFTTHAGHGFQGIRLGDAALMGTLAWLCWRVEPAAISALQRRLVRAGALTAVVAWHGVVQWYTGRKTADETVFATVVLIHVLLIVCRILDWREETYTVQ